MTLLINEELTSATNSSSATPNARIVPFEQRFLNFSINGVTSSTVQVRRKLKESGNFKTIKQYSSNQEGQILHASPTTEYDFNVSVYGGGDTITVKLED